MCLEENESCSTHNFEKMWNSIEGEAIERNFNRKEFECEKSPNHVDFNEK